MGYPELPSVTRQVVLVARPDDGPLAPEQFRVDELPVPVPAEGEVLVRTDYLGVAAVQRELMKGDTDLPFGPWELGEPVNGYGLGTVVAVGPGQVGAATGDLVAHHTPWAEYAVSSQVQVLDPHALPDPSYHLSNGPTALYGVRDIAQVGDGDVVLVSGAAGGVGALAGQIARKLGAARVIGTAGTPAKCAWLVDELGYDAAVDYHGDDLADRIRQVAPDGIDVFVDLVGGRQFEVAVQVAAPHARFALGGALATQLGGDAWPRLDVQGAMLKDLRFHAFALMHGLHAIGEWPALAGRWLAEGMVDPHTVIDGGLDAVPRALIDLVAGRHSGTVIVRLA